MDVFKGNRERQKGFLFQNTCYKKIKKSLQHLARSNQAMLTSQILTAWLHK